MIVFGFCIIPCAMRLSALPERSARTKVNLTIVLRNKIRLLKSLDSTPSTAPVSQS